MVRESRKINRYFEIPQLGDFDIEVWNKQSEEGEPTNWYCRVHGRTDKTAEYSTVACLTGDTLREVVTQLRIMLPLPCDGC